MTEGFGLCSLQGIVDAYFFSDEEDKMNSVKDIQGEIVDFSPAFLRQKGNRSCFYRGCQARYGQSVI